MHGKNFPFMKTSIARATHVKIGSAENESTLMHFLATEVDDAAHPAWSASDARRARSQESCRIGRQALSEPERFGPHRNTRREAQAFRRLGACGCRERIASKVEHWWSGSTRFALYRRDTRNLDGGLEVIAGIGGAGRRTFRERWPIRLSRRDTSAINAERSSIRRRHSACLLPRGPLCAAAVWAKPRPFPIPSLC